MTGLAMRVREEESERFHLRVCEDAQELAREAAAFFVERLREQALRGKRLTMLLPGGHTPRLVFERLAELATGQVPPPWGNLELFWGDERIAPQDDPASNFGLANGTLLSRVPIPRARIHPVPVEQGTPEEIARAYERELRERFATTDSSGAAFPSFDIAWLGLGPDGHTASLFPEALTKAALQGPEWVIAPAVVKEGHRRVSLTLPALCAAREVVFVVEGESKAEILRRILSGEAPALPASRVRPAIGAPLWLVDRAAAQLLPCG